ncbi:MAG: glycosyl hydrolase [Sulfuricaulis sp.]|nr:glycosyl hydrolase [Sulfuricaulis sp.]
MDWQHDSAAAFNQRLGMPAAVYVAFFRFPFDNVELNNLDNFIAQVARQRGMALITLEPHDGLNAITPQIASDLAILLATYNRRGIPVFVRFAHEMNGFWYPWSQQPKEYVRAFRALAYAIHRHAPLTAMLWAPNYGGSHPFAGIRHDALPGSSNFQLLDTNMDGRIDLLDDMYTPYYPGDDAVDWVGMSLYHWGRKHPWGENETPEEYSFVDRITGRYKGMNGDERTVPNFYRIYVEQHRKPMAITETAALYNPAAVGASGRKIKQAWWRQVFNQQVARDFPGIKMINWFEWKKFESEVGGVIDWRVTFDPEITKAFMNDLPRQGLIFATDLQGISIYQ